MTAADKNWKWLFACTLRYLHSRHELNEILTPPPYLALAVLPYDTHIHYIAHKQPRLLCLLYCHLQSSTQIELFTDWVTVDPSITFPWRGDIPFYVWSYGIRSNNKSLVAFLLTEWPKSSSISSWSLVEKLHDMAGMSIEVADKCSLAILALESLPLTSRQLLHVATGIDFSCKGVTLEGITYWSHLAKHLLGEQVHDVLYSMLNTYFDNLPTSAIWTTDLASVIVNTLSRVSSGPCSQNRKMSSGFSRYISLYMHRDSQQSKAQTTGPDTAMRRMSAQGWIPVDMSESKQDTREIIGTILRLLLKSDSRTAELLSLVHWLASGVQVGFTRSSLNFAFRKRHTLKLPASLVYYLSVSSPPYIKIRMVNKLKSVILLANKLVDEASYTTHDFKPYWFFTETHNKQKAIPKTLLSSSEDEYNNRVMCTLQQQIKWDRSANSGGGTSQLLKLVSWPAQFISSSAAQTTRQNVVEYILRLKLSQQPIQCGLGFSTAAFDNLNVPKYDNDMASIDLTKPEPLFVGQPRTFCTLCTDGKNIQRTHRQSPSFLKYIKQVPQRVLLDLCITICSSLLQEWSSKRFTYCQGAIWYLLDCVIRWLATPCTLVEKQRQSEFLCLVVACSVWIEHRDCSYYLSVVRQVIKSCPIEALQQEHQWLNLITKWYDTSQGPPVTLQTKCTLLRFLCSWPGNLNTLYLLEEVVSCIGMPSDDVCTAQGNPLCFTVCEFGSNVCYTKWVVQVLKILLQKTSVDLSWRGSSGQTLLHCALQTQNVSLTRFMIENRPTPKTDLELFNVAGQSINDIIQAIGVNAVTGQRRRRASVPSHQKHKKNKKLVTADC
jgi:hypothetical protein